MITQHTSPSKTTNLPPEDHHVHPQPQPSTTQPNLNLSSRSNPSSDQDQHTATQPVHSIIPIINPHHPQAMMITTTAIDHHSPQPQAHYDHPDDDHEDDPATPTNQPSNPFLSLSQPLSSSSSSSSIDLHTQSNQTKSLTTTTQTTLHLSSSHPAHEPAPDSTATTHPPPDHLPPPPTHFLSRASRRLPELHQQLNLNPELPLIEANYDHPPTETDPLLNLQAIKSALDSPSLTTAPSTLPPNPIHQPPSSQSIDSPSIALSSPNQPVPLPKVPKKLNTFDGVFLPTILSIFNVVYFMRFGYCIGRIGLLGTGCLLLLAYLINILTVFSLSAIATNGQVRGGGAYYLISRTLGPEFGGSIGILFCLSQAMTAAMNIIGFVETLINISQLNPRHVAGGSQNHSPHIQNMSSTLIRYFLKSFALLGATIACITLGRNKIFCGMTRSVSLLLIFTLLSILLSFLNKKPFSDDHERVVYTSFSISTFKQNLYPDYRLFENGQSFEIQAKFSDYQQVFGIIFPSLSGMLAGSSLSGELRKPSRSLPLGMISALICIIVIYLITLVCLSMTCVRESFISLNSQGFLNLIILRISSYPTFMSLGLLLYTIFSSIMGITVCGKILQAVSRDGLIPILKPFFSQGSRIGDDPVYSIILCSLVCEIALFYTVGGLAIHITTISLLVFACINLACFTLRVAGSPNFRPSFRLFSEWTALLGLGLAFLSMYLVGPVSASTSIIAMIVLFMVIHYSSPAKQWGEVTQSIIYHQVRKYLLRLDERKDNVKYWRPQILLFTNDPRHDWNQIVFCNSLKKGGLYVLAHIIKSEFSPEAIKELQEQQLNWLGLVDISNIKAFVDLTLAPDERVGARQFLLTAGLGGMRPNICILGFPTNLKWRGKGRLVETSMNSPTSPSPLRAKRRSDSSLTVRGMIIESTADVTIDCLGSLPTDSQRSETPIKPTDFVGIIEDALSLNKSVGLTYGFQGLRLPESISRPQTVDSNDHPGSQISGFQLPNDDHTKRWIDLWPILRDGESGWETYTMVLQLGMILSMVPSWRHHHHLRVTIFCEYDDEIAEEQRRMEKLMSDLRIRATLRVVVLANGHIQSYECLVKGKTVDLATWSKLESTLAGDPWWETLKFMRAQDGPPSDLSIHNKTSHPKEPSKPKQDCSKCLDQNLLKKNSQINNIRIKALHPLSRRGSHQTSDSTTKTDDTSATDDDDDDLILEENDGDDDTVAREAYNRNKKPDLLRGLPDEPIRAQSKTTAHRVPIFNYGSTFEQPTLDLESLSPSFIHDEMIPSSGSHRRTNAVRSSSSVAASTSISVRADGHSQSTGLNQKIPNRNKHRKGLASILHRELLLNKSNDLSNPSSGRTRVSLDDLKRHRYHPNGSMETNDLLFKSERFSSSPSSSSTFSSSNDNDSSFTPSSLNSSLPPPPPVVELDFNSLPMHAQLICLNELIKFNSKNDHGDSLSPHPSAPHPIHPEHHDYHHRDHHLELYPTGIIFTSLPPPESGVSSSFEGSARYLDQLESFLDDLPPVLAIYAKQFTVTASL